MRSATSPQTGLMILTFGILTLKMEVTCNVTPPPSVWPHLFRGAGHEKRRAEQLKWSLAFSLYIGSFPCAQLPLTSSYSPVGPSVFCVFSLGLYFVYSFVFFYLFVCLHPFMFPWAVESSPLQFLA